MANVRTCLFTSQLGLPGHFWSLESLMCARITRLMQIYSKKIRLPCWHKIRLLHDAFRGTIGSQTQLRKSASKRKRYQDRYWDIIYQKDSKGTTLGCFLQAVPKNCYAIIRHLSDTSEERPEEKLILTATSSFGPSVLPSTLRCCASDIDVCCCLPCLMAIGQRCLDILRHLETCWDTCFNSEMELGCIASKELLGQCASSWLWSASSDHTRRTSETTTRISSNQPEPDTKGRSLQDAILSDLWSVRIRSLRSQVYLP